MRVTASAKPVEFRPRGAALAAFAHLRAAFAPVVLDCLLKSRLIKRWIVRKLLNRSIRTGTEAAQERVIAVEFHGPRPRIARTDASQAQTRARLAGFHGG